MNYLLVTQFHHFKLQNLLSVVFKVCFSIYDLNILSLFFNFSEYNQPKPCYIVTETKQNKNSKKRTFNGYFSRVLNKKRNYVKWGPFIL